MNTIWARAAAVSGARHLRRARNGQDAAASWVGTGDSAGAAAIVVCDGCGSSASSEVGARLGAQLVIAAVATRLQAGESPAALWSDGRTQVAAALRPLADAMPGGRAAAIREHFLFTIVAAAVQGDEACVWAIGDGAFACGDPDAARGGAARGGAARGGAARGAPRHA
jgi:serine/threonine protein phosphatase PrpC